MEKINKQRSAQHTAERGIIATSVMRFFQLLLFLLLTLLFSIVIEWAGMAVKFWDEPGAKHSATMLEKELGYLNNDFKQSAIVEQPLFFAQQFANKFYLYTFEKTGVKSAVIWLATPTNLIDTNGFRKKLHALYLSVADYFQALATVIQIFAVRLAVLILAFPAFILLSLTGLIDGLVQRDIRRWSAGRESSFKYHWAKIFLYPSLVLPWILYLAMPTSIHPNYIVLPFAFLFSISVTVMASTFKKYL
jgi:integrating conjugative element membrane protein (TIGR03747 family)